MTTDLERNRLGRQQKKNVKHTCQTIVFIEKTPGECAIGTWNWPVGVNCSHALAASELVSRRRRSLASICGEINAGLTAPPGGGGDPSRRRQEKAAGREKGSGLAPNLKSSRRVVVVNHAYRWRGVEGCHEVGEKLLAIPPSRCLTGLLP